jgi:hypothetical protein
MRHCRRSVVVIKVDRWDRSCKRVQLESNETLNNVRTVASVDICWMSGYFVFCAWVAQSIPRWSSRMGSITIAACDTGL